MANIPNCLLVTVAVCIGLVQCGHNRVSSPTQARAANSIAEIVVADARFSTLLAAVKAAGLVDTLAGPGTFTVFAPTNEAFAKVPAAALTDLLSKPDDLKAVLLRHVLPTIIEAKDIPRGQTTVDTVGGAPLTVINDAGGVSVQTTAGTAKVIITDVRASNGVIHAIDTVV